MTKTCWTNSPDPISAVEELLEGLCDPFDGCVLFYCSTRYNLDTLAQAIQATFRCDVFGCTSAGEIVSRVGYASGGIAAVHLNPAETKHRIFLFPDLHSMTNDELQDFGHLPIEFSRSFGILLIDGLSHREEFLASNLYTACRGMPIVGGSAGDDGAFEKTSVFAEGRFHTNAAVLAVFETRRPFHHFHVHHYKPRNDRLVVTASDPSARKLIELDGMPAAIAYAKAIDVPLKELDRARTSINPLMLKGSHNYYVRGIRQIEPNYELSLFCAIETGVVLRVGRSTDILENLRTCLKDVTAVVGKPSIILGFDCIQRRLELEGSKLLPEIERELRSCDVFAFSTYGEQYNGVHVNQTLTGVAVA